MRSPLRIKGPLIPYALTLVSSVPDAWERHSLLMEDSKEMEATIITLLFTHLDQWALKVTSPSGLSLLPVWAGGRTHFSLLSWASRTPAVKEEVMVDDEKLEAVPELCYQGDMLSAGSGCQLAEVTSRKCPWGKFPPTAPPSHQRQSAASYQMFCVFNMHKECDAACSFGHDGGYTKQAPVQ